MAAALRIEGLTHRYGRLAALRGLDLEVGSGEVACLLGPSGCGKTTALRLAAGLETLQEGRLWIDGAPVAEPGRQVPPEDRDIGLVFQDHALFPHLSVLDNTMFGLRRLPRAERRERALRMLRRVHLEEYADAFPHALSGGQRQRVALARALAPGPRLMLLDEPYSSLDPRLRDRMRDEVLHLLKTSGRATLMVTHDAEEAMFMADRIALMREGRVVQFGSPAELYCAPADAFVAGFLGDINRVGGVARDGAVETAFGPVPANGLGDGADAEVAIRPEAVRLSDAGGGGRPLAIVVESRLLGRTTLVHLSYPWRGRRLHLHARTPDVRGPEPGDVVSVDLDLSRTFVFPAGGPSV